MTRIISRAQIIITIPLLLLMGICAGVIGEHSEQPAYHYALPRQHVQMIGNIAVTTDAKLLAREAEKTICSKFQMPGCPVKHGRAG